MDGGTLALLPTPMVLCFLGYEVSSMVQDPKPYTGVGLNIFSSSSHSLTIRIKFISL